MWLSWQLRTIIKELSAETVKRKETALRCLKMDHLSEKKTTKSCYHLPTVYSVYIYKNFYIYVLYSDIYNILCIYFIYSIYILALHKYIYFLIYIYILKYFFWDLFYIKFESFSKLARRDVRKGAHENRWKREVTVYSSEHSYYSYWATTTLLLCKPGTTKLWEPHNP